MVKQILYFIINHIRRKTPISTINTCIYNVITFANNKNIILRQLIPRAINTAFLQIYSFVIRSNFDKNNIKCKKNKTKLFFSLETN